MAKELRVGWRWGIIMCEGPDERRGERATAIERFGDGALADCQCDFRMVCDRSLAGIYVVQGECIQYANPLVSWSRYWDQLSPWLSKNLDPNWTRDVKRLQELLQRGDSINQMMQVTGEEGITLEDYVTWQKSVLLDMAFLQQDAFDEVDACMPRERQLESLRLIKGLIDRDYGFHNRDEAREFFTKVIGLYKNWNYSPPGSQEYEKYKNEIEENCSRAPLP